MKLNVLYFASLRETLGVSREELEFPVEVATVAQARDWLRQRGGVWASTLDNGKNVRAALNQRMAGAETALVEGGELAFFPPVTGG